VDRKTTRETGSISQQLCHQDIKDHKTETGRKFLVAEDVFPGRQDTVLLRSAPLSSIFTREVVYEQEENDPQHRP